MVCATAATLLLCAGVAGQDTDGYWGLPGKPPTGTMWSSFTPVWAYPSDLVGGWATRVSSPLGGLPPQDPAMLQRLGAPPDLQAPLVALRYGGNAGAIVGGLHAFDLVRRSWSSLTTFNNEAGSPGPRARHAAAVVGGRLYIHGGVDDSRPARLLKDVKSLDLLTLEWRDETDLVAPVARIGATAHAYVTDSKSWIVFVGGTDNTTTAGEGAPDTVAARSPEWVGRPYPVAAILDLRSRSWIIPELQGPAADLMALGRIGHLADSFERWVVVAVGRPLSMDTDYVESVRETFTSQVAVFDCETLEWSSVRIAGFTEQQAQNGEVLAPDLYIMERAGALDPVTKRLWTVGGCSTFTEDRVLAFLPCVVRDLVTGSVPMFAVAFLGDLFDALETAAGSPGPADLTNETVQFWRFTEDLEIRSDSRPYNGLYALAACSITVAAFPNSTQPGAAWPRGFVITGGSNGAANFNQHLIMALDRSGSQERLAAVKAEPLPAEYIGGTPLSPRFVHASTPIRGGSAMFVHGGCSSPSTFSFNPFCMDVASNQLPVEMANGERFFDAHADSSIFSLHTMEWEESGHFPHLPTEYGSGGRCSHTVVEDPRNGASGEQRVFLFGGAELHPTGGALSSMVPALPRSMSDMWSIDVDNPEAGWRLEWGEESAGVGPSPLMLHGATVIPAGQHDAFLVCGGYDFSFREDMLLNIMLRVVILGENLGTEKYLTTVNFVGRSACWAWRLDSSQWVEAPELPVKLSAVALVVIDDIAYCVGGIEDLRVSSERLNLQLRISSLVHALPLSEWMEAGQWGDAAWHTFSPVGSSPEPRAAAAAAVIGHKIIINSGVSAPTSTYVLDVQTKEWSALPNACFDDQSDYEPQYGRPTGSLYGHSAVADGSRVVFFGGLTGIASATTSNEPQNTVYVVSTGVHSVQVDADGNDAACQMRDHSACATLLASVAHAAQPVSHGAFIAAGSRQRVEVDLYNFGESLSRPLRIAVPVIIGGRGGADAVRIRCPPLTDASQGCIEVVAARGSTPVTLTKLELLPQGGAGSVAGLSRAVWADTTAIELVDVSISGFRNNERGGGIAAVDSSVTLTSVSISNCTSHRGGAAAFVSSVVVADNVRVEQNNAALEGGGLHLAFTEIRGSGLQVLRNVVGGERYAQLRTVGGGGIFCSGARTVTIEDSVVSMNAVLDDAGNVAGAGGGIYSVQSGPLANSTILEGNQAARGGAVALILSDSAAIENSMLLNNSAGVGGALHCAGCTAFSVRASRFLSNRAQESGGAAAFEGASEVALTSSDVADNTAELGSGGGIYVNVDVGRVVIAANFSGGGNEAPRGGGGAVYWHGRQPPDVTASVLPLHTQQPNSAGYGPNYASRPSAVVVEDVSGLESGEFERGEQFGVTVHIVDQLEQLVRADGDVTLEVIAAPPASVLSGRLASVVSGTAQFEGLSVTSASDSDFAMLAFAAGRDLVSPAIRIALLPCPPGTRESGPPMFDRCQACEPGTFSHTRGQRTCFTCPHGFAPSASAAECVACAPGMMRGDGDVGCKRCTPGRFSTGAAGACDACPQGTWSDEGATECELCAAGTFSAGGGHSCGTCQAGTYSGVGAANCIECPPGRFQSEIGRNSCPVCSRGTVASTSGLRECLPCPDGSFADAEHVECLACPSGGEATDAVQCANGLATVNGGFWIVPESPGAVAELRPESQVLRCLDRDACVASGGNTTECAPGRTGVLCGVCESGWARLGGQCVECLSSGANVVLSVITFGVVVAVITIIVYKRVARDQLRQRTENKGVVRITINLLQTLAIISLYRAQSPPSVVALLRAAELSNGAVLSLLPVECFLGWSFLGKLVVYFLTPILAVLMPMAVIRLRRAWVERVLKRHGIVRQRQTTVLGRHASLGASPTLSPTSPSSEGRHSAASVSSPTAVAGDRELFAMPTRVYYENMTKTAIVVCVFCVYNAVSRAMLMPFSLIGAEVYGTSWVETDLSVSTSSSEYAIATILCVTGTVVYVIGVPATALAFLVRSKDRLYETRWAQVYGFLVDGYDDRRGLYWWEITVLTRKILVTASLAFIQTPFLQLWTSVVVVVLSLVIHLHVKPYVNSALNNYESAALFSLVVLQLCTLAYEQDKSSEVLVAIVIYSTLVVVFGALFLGSVPSAKALLVRTCRRMLPPSVAERSHMKASAESAARSSREVEMTPVPAPQGASGVGAGLRGEVDIRGAMTVNPMHQQAREHQPPAQ